MDRLATRLDHGQDAPAETGADGGAQVLVGTDYIQQIRYGSSSGVLLLWTYRTIELLDMSNGKRISHIEGAGGNMPGELSPNAGRCSHCLRQAVICVPGGCRDR